MKAMAPVLESLGNWVFWRAAENVFALDRALVEILQVDPKRVPTIKMSRKLGYCPALKQIDFPFAHPQDLPSF